MMVSVEQLPEEELRELAKEKNKNGVATKAALAAQRILYERLHWPGGTTPSQCRDRHGNKYTKTGVRYGHTYD